MFSRRISSRLGGSAAIAQLADESCMLGGLARAIRGAHAAGGAPAAADEAYNFNTEAYSEELPGQRRQAPGPRHPNPIKENRTLNDWNNLLRTLAKHKKCAHSRGWEPRGHMRLRRPPPPMPPPPTRPRV